MKNLKFPFWSIFLAIFCYFPIAYFQLSFYYAILPTAYLAFVFVMVSVYAIKRTFFNGSNNKKR